MMREILALARPFIKIDRLAQLDATQSISATGQPCSN